MESKRGDFTSGPAQTELADVFVKAQQGDAAAWKDLVRRFASLVYSIPRRYGFAAEACEDVSQAVFVILLKKLASVQSPHALPKWLMTTTHRECKKFSRSKLSAIPEGVDDLLREDSPPEDAMEKWEQEHLVRVALDDLGGRCKALLTALFLDPTNPAYDEIAQRLNIPVGSIGPTRTRCLAKLAELLTDVE
jgi:RNA polymerase sigma factor (sigma-70 family)